MIRGEDINSIESESGIIASLIHNPELSFYSEYLLPNHFTNKENRCVYTAICELARKGITTIDPYMKTLRTYIDSIFAGAMIAIGAIIYLNCPNRIVGSFLFSIGLITIMEFDFNLYTGKVGFARSWRDAPYLLSILLMNAVGCLFIMAMPTQDASAIWSNRLDYPLYVVFAKAVVCGILIYICVHQHRTHSTTSSLLTTLVAIPAFILCGAEHSIADICFMFAARDFTLKGALFILVVALGNAAGSLTLSVWVAKRDELHQNHKNRYC